MYRNMFNIFSFIRSQSNGEFYEAEKDHIKNPSPPLNLTVTNYLSQYCYDATWAFALVLNKTIEGIYVILQCRAIILALLETQTTVA